MKSSDNLIKFIGSYETATGEPSLTAVKSPEQNSKETKYEIGWGHNSDSYFQVNKNTKITYEKAIDLLHYDIKEAEDIINKFLKTLSYTPPQHEFDAMVSARYNGIPIGSSKCSLTQAIRLHDLYQIQKCWSMWVYMTVKDKTGKPQKVRASGLVKRRQDELRIYIEGIYERT